MPTCNRLGGCVEAVLCCVGERSCISLLGHGAKCMIFGMVTCESAVVKYTNLLIY
jgi:hypothetical protein